MLIKSSYTCGAIWQTCECTEADQTQREAEIAERLAKYEAETQAEEAEVRAAIAAVEEAERRVAQEREAEERAAEEARQAQEAEEATRLEYERVEGINDFFQELRKMLERIDSQQKEAIAHRHDMHDIPNIQRMQTELSSDSICQKRIRQIDSERASILANNRAKIQDLRRQHRAFLHETIKRHRHDQDEVFLQPIVGPETRRGALTENILNSLMESQEYEKKIVRSQQAREISKWQARGAAQVAEFDEIMHEEKTRFEKIHAAKTEGVTHALKTARAQIYSDWKWVDTLVAARQVMLVEDETRMIMSGADAPQVWHDTLE